MSELFKAGDRVRISREKASQFSRQAMQRAGRVVRVRDDGLAVIKWDDLISQQVLTPLHLERVES